MKRGEFSGEQTLHRLEHQKSSLYKIDHKISFLEPEITEKLSGVKI
jgi:hypothetical protein